MIFPILTSRKVLMAALPSAMLLAACSNEDLINAEQAVNANGEITANVTASGTVSGSTATNVQSVPTCSMVSVSSGIHVICNGTLVGVLTNSQVNTSGTNTGNQELAGCRGGGCGSS